MAESKRTTRTPRERAEEALGVAQRRVEKIAAKLATARREVTGLETELAEANQRLKYAQADPALPQIEPDAAAPVEEEGER